MAIVKQISKNDFLNGYAENEIYDVINVQVGTEQRIYGKTRIGAGDEIKGFIVVYAVV